MLVKIILFVWQNLVLVYRRKLRRVGLTHGKISWHWWCLPSGGFSISSPFRCVLQKTNFNRNQFLNRFSQKQFSFVAGWRASKYFTKRPKRNFKIFPKNQYSKRNSHRVKQASTRLYVHYPLEQKFAYGQTKQKLAPNLMFNYHPFETKTMPRIFPE